MHTKTRVTARKANTYYVILISGAAALGGFLFGFDTAVINGAILVPNKFVCKELGS
jgi:MFS transporter, SP family, sugar:H+ symporter